MIELGSPGTLPADAGYIGNFHYRVYGLHLLCPFSLPLPAADVGSIVDVAFLVGADELFASALAQVHLDAEDWIHHAELSDGSSYLRYDEMFHFVVSADGRQISYAQLGEFSAEAFHTYALGRVFSFALVKMGIEPLHAATVAVDGGGVAFLGASTFGKSSLAACFVAGGYPLLTDDVLCTRSIAGQMFALSGPSRLKLFPRIGRLFFGDRVEGVRMSPRATKLVFSMSPSDRQAADIPLKVVYAVTPPRDVRRKQRISIEPLSPREALLKLLGFSHNHRLTDTARLQRQFLAARQLVDLVPVRKLTYPRLLSALPDVRAAVLADLQRSDTW